MPEEEWFTVVEVAKMLKVSRDTVTRQFENEPGVIDLGVPTRRYKRRHRILRIPTAALNRFPLQDASGVTGGLSRTEKTTALLR